MLLAGFDYNTPVTSYTRDLCICYYTSLLTSFDLDIPTREGFDVAMNIITGSQYNHSSDTSEALIIIFHIHLPPFPPSLPPSPLLLLLFGKAKKPSRRSPFLISNITQSHVRECLPAVMECECQSVQYYMCHIYGLARLVFSVWLYTGLRNGLFRNHQ